MRLRSMLPVAAAALFVGLAAVAQVSKHAPSNLLVDVSVRPYPNTGPILVPGDRVDKPAFVAAILLHHPPTQMTYGFKRFVVFPDEPVKGSYSAAGLTVDYSLDVKSKEHRAEAKVSVRRGQDFVCGSSSDIWLPDPRPGIQPAPGK